MKYVVLLVIYVLLTACTGSDTGSSTAVTEGEWRCPLPSGGFEESSLVGTWHLDDPVSPRRETIALKADGTYQQRLEQAGEVLYESAWNRWSVERRPSGGLYLHLEAMRYCELTGQICERPQGGTGNILLYDICEDRPLTMEDEVLLAIVGTQDERIQELLDAPRGIMLLHMRHEIDVPGSFFILEEQ
jgi:hypothetical protein